LLLGAGSVCDLGASRPDKPVLAAGKYAVESIRSRAQLEGTDQLIEISETGPDDRYHRCRARPHAARRIDPQRERHCRLALAVSVDGEEPGISDRACRWSVDGPVPPGRRQRSGNSDDVRGAANRRRVVLEGMSDLDPQGTWSAMRAASASCWCSVRGIRGPFGDRTPKGRPARDPGVLHDL